MTKTQKVSAIMKHAWSEPRFAAEMEWNRLFSIGAQLFGQVPYSEMEHYAATGQHVNPEREITLTLHEPPDWDWWEPTSEWRRKAGRERDLECLLKQGAA